MSDDLELETWLAADQDDIPGAIAFSSEGTGHGCGLVAAIACVLAVIVWVAVRWTT